MRSSQSFPSAQAASLLVALAITACGAHDSGSGVAEAQSGHATMRTGLDRTSSGLTTVQSGETAIGLGTMRDGMGMLRDGGQRMRSGYGMMGGGAMGNAAMGGMMAKCGSPSTAMDAMDQALGTMQDGYGMMANGNAVDLQTGIRKCEAALEAARMPMNAMDEWMTCMGQ